MITSKGAYFIADTQVRPNPELARGACGKWRALAAIHVPALQSQSRKSRFVSHSDFGSYDYRFLTQDAPCQLRS